MQKYIDIKGAREYMNPKEENNSIFSYDDDGVMLWHGKRCESSPYSDDEINELEELLKEFK